MSWICIHCGHEFDEPMNRYNRRWSDSDDSAAYCPNCGSEDIEEAEECEACGALKAKDRLLNGWCEDCINIAASDYFKVRNYGQDRKEAVEINGLLAWAFSADEIQEILERELMNSYKIKEYAYKYASDDRFDFVDWLKKEEA